MCLYIQYNRLNYTKILFKAFVFVCEWAEILMYIKDRKEVIQSLQRQMGHNILENDESRIGKYVKKQYLRVFVEKAPFPMTHTLQIKSWAAWSAWKWSLGASVALEMSLLTRTGCCSSQPHGDMRQQSEGEDAYQTAGIIKVEPTHIINAQSGCIVANISAWRSLCKFFCIHVSGWWWEQVSYIQMSIWR